MCGVATVRGSYGDLVEQAVRAPGLCSALARWNMPECTERFSYARREARTAVMQAPLHAHSAVHEGCLQ